MKYLTQQGKNSISYTLLSEPAIADCVFQLALSVVEKVAQHKDTHFVIYSREALPFSFDLMSAISKVSPTLLFTYSLLEDIPPESLSGKDVIVLELLGRKNLHSYCFKKFSTAQSVTTCVFLYSGSHLEEDMLVGHTLKAINAPIFGYGASLQGGYFKSLTSIHELKSKAFDVYQQSEDNKVDRMLHSFIHTI